MGRNRTRPKVIQGGMGVAVSSWELARAVARCGGYGVVSGTGIETVMVRELQDGDPANRRKVMLEYPDQTLARELIEQFYNESGRAEGEPYDLLPIHRFDPTVRSQKILSLAAFSEVRLAQQGHDGVIGINFLSELKRFTLAGLYGSMLAGVDAVFMGAGIPKEEAEQIDRLAHGEPGRLRLNPDTSQAENPEESYEYVLDPADLLDEVPSLDRPDFFPIVASDSLAKILDHKLNAEQITGWIIEGPVAGGHNAPPRNKKTDSDGNPVYDERDRVDLERVRDLGYPFYRGGGFGSPERLRQARENGAEGIQVGSLFSLAEESGYPESTKRKILNKIIEEDVEVRTDGRASPTGFPFKVLEMEGTLSEQSVYEKRRRICDLGYLQEPYVDEQGNLRGRCPSEPVEDYRRKGGDPEETEGRQCLCNALMANIGRGQSQDWGTEPPLFTAGDQFENFPLDEFAELPYSARDVLSYLRNGS